LSEPVVLHVTNGLVNIGAIRVIGMSSSASLLVGDADSLTLYSFFDTPPESLIVGPLAPLPELPETDVTPDDTDNGTQNGADRTAKHAADRRTE